MKTPMPESRVANGTVGFALQILFALLFLAALTGQALAANCTATYTNTSSGGSTNYTLNYGNSLKIASGTYTGTINNFSSTSTICVETGATFTPSNLNNPAGTLANYGTTTLSGAAFNAGTVIHNYGTFTFTGSPNTNGATTFYNHTNATMSAPTFQLGSNSTFTNDGLMTATGDLNTTTGTTLTNNYRIEVDGNFNPDGTFTNNGRAYAKNFINMNSSATIINNCALVSYNGFNSNNPNVTNNGTILITKPNNKWQHNGSGVFRNGPNAKVAGYDFINSATVTGSGAMIFSGSTTNQGAFTGNSSTDKINFYDETQTGSQFFDFQNTVPTNTVRTAFTRPTELDTPTACSTDYKSFALAGTTGTITGTVYTDSNGNNALDATETKLPNITVWLYNSTGATLLQTKTTDASGTYSFTNVTAGTYQIKVDTADAQLPIGTTIGTTHPLTAVAVTAGATTANQNFGFDTVVTSKDFGDAPATYGNASHTIISGIYLGNNPPDAETASKYSYNARADNNDDGAPSQPVSDYIPLFPVLQMTDTSYSAGFKVTNTTGTAGKLYGWIDFDQSGTFESSEAAVVNVPTGSNKATVSLNWTNIPANIKLGTTIIRLRLTTDSSVTTSTPTGNASNGEVEDYPIAVAMDIPPNSPTISIVSGATPAACEAVVFQDNFNDLAGGIYWGSNRAGSQAIRNWSRSGGGNDTYAQTVSTASSGTAIYFGNGAVRQISPSIGTGFNFDANGKLLTTIDAISLRDNIDDSTPGFTTATGSSEADWGPNPVTLSRTFATTAGKTYRLYFKAIPEDLGGAFVSGIMRLDAPGGSIHFKAPGSSEGIQSYAIEFTALGSSSTISFTNYGHVENDSSGWCDPNSVYNANAWCSPGGRTDAKHANELIIDDVVLTEAGCPDGISGIVYTDSNTNNTLDASETKLPNITVKLYNSTKTTVLQTTSTNASGTYTFSTVPVGTYQVEVDTADTDLPAGASIGTPNPLTGVVVTSGATTSNQNFGFDAAVVPAACTPPTQTSTGGNDSITWNHNPYSPASQTTGGHPWPLVLNNGLIASANNELISNLTTGPTDWELYTEATSVPATLAQAISGNKYFQYSFTTQPTLANANVLYGVAMSTLGPLNVWNHSGKYKIQVQIADNAAFSSPKVIKNLIQIDENNPTTGGTVSEGPLYGSDFYISHYDLDAPFTLAANKTYYVRFYLYDVTTAGVGNSTPSRIIFDDLLLKTYDCGSLPSTLLSITDAVVKEGDSGLTNLNFPVQLSAAAPAGGVSFDYTTADGTATLANNDYQAKSGKLTIPIGANGSVISIPVVGDTNIEPNEKIKLNITNVVNARFAASEYPQPPQGTIIDDDAAVACNASSGQFGGIVFQDYNQNGSHEVGEIGLAGVTVTAYNSSNASAATATTNADGWYVLNGLTTGTQYRLEFNNLPAGAESGSTGNNSASNVQFITASATCSADMGVYNPVDYCQADPKLLTARYVNGDTSTTGADLAGTFGAIMSFNYNASGINPALNTDALGSQVGGIWGLAYNRSTKKAFASAVIRRHMGLGPLGIGGIYAIDYSTTPPTVSNFLNVDGFAGIDVGSITSNSARGLPGDPFAPNHDPTVFDKVGKEGLGDMELSDDGNTLYVTNLYSRKIIKLDLSTYNTNGTMPTTATQISLPSVSCNKGVARPFGLKHYRGKLFAGITCTGENGGTSADLKASIQAYDGTSWTEKLQVPLNYKTWHADDSRASEYSRYNIPWVSSLSALTLGNHGTMDWADDSQLLLSGIEFDTNGDLLMGFIDRTGLQFGQYNYGTDTSSNRFYGVFSNGELLKASYNATTGAYTLENAGIANGVAGEGAKTGTDPAWPYGGPGGGEFYGGEKFTGHTENGFGALAVIPGKQELALNAMNPFNITTGGTIWLNNNTGTRSRGVQLYGADNRYFGKAVGLGDIEVLCDPAPTEIGNRVWLDTNKDGIQDAGEAGINNVTVTLACGTDTATATTNTAGEYYFSNKTGGNATFMDAGESCTLKVNGSQTSLSSYTLTTQNADSKTDNNRYTDIRDSDAANNAGTAEIAFTVGSSGQNNHGLDFGYQAAATTPTVAKDYGDIPDSYHTKQSNNGASHTIVANFSLGATVDGETDGQPTAAADGDGADEDGVHFITPLLPGESALIAVGTTQTSVATAYVNGWIDFNHDGDFADANEHIITDQTIASVYTTLALLANIPADAIPGDTYARFRLSSASGTSYDGAAADGEVEDYKVTITAPSRIGDTVWLDTNKNGIQDAGEAGVQGVTVKLYRKSDNRLLGAKLTDSTGNYFFVNELAAGTYYLEFTKPAGYQFTLQDAGTDPALNSDADPTTGRTGDITVVAGIPQTQWDAGLIANALVVTQCQAIPFSTTQVDHNFSVPKFDGALGTLTGVQVNAYSGIKQIWALENRSTSAASFKITSTMPASFTLPNASNLALDYSYNSGIFSIPAFDGVSDYVGTSGKSLDAWRYEGSAVSNNYTPTADFVAANAGESVTLPYSSGEGSMSLVGGGGNALFTIRTQASAGVCVNYTYTPPPPPSLGCSVLDNFDSTSVETIDLTSSSQGSVTQTWNANVDTLIGGARTLTFGPAPRGTATNGYGLLDIANNAGTAANMKLCYNANGAGLNVNVSQIENILLNVSEDEHHNPDAATRANIPMTITLSDGFNSASLTQDMVSLAYQQLGTTDGWVNLRFPLANFTNINNLNRTNVQSVCIEVAGKQGHDYAFEKVMLEDTNTCSSVTGKVFEDVNYGGGASRAFSSAASAKGVNGARLELYSNSGKLIESTNSYLDASNGAGTYTFAALTSGDYYVRAVSDTVKSTRSGANGTEVGVMIYRTDGITPTTTEKGGRKPSAIDAAVNDRETTLNTGTFTFSGGTLNNKPAQAIQPITLSSTNPNKVDFGFNFSTVVNTNDSGQGSLRQFLLNANLLGDDSTLAQTGRIAGKENAILELPTTDPNYNTAKGYWSIPLQSALPAITSPLMLDGSLPAGSNNNPTLELKGTTAGAGSNGLTLQTGGSGSTIRKLAINGFSGAAIYLNGSSNNSLQANYLGVTPANAARSNTGAGILLNAASNNLIGGAASGAGNIIANNAGDGIAVTGATSQANAMLGNSIFNNTGLGIDLGDNGVTPNDPGDTDTGPNNLLNFPEVKTSSFGANGTKVITYDFDLDVPAGDYRLEFFASTAKDPSGNGEGQVFLGYKDLNGVVAGSHNIKGTFNANMTVVKGTFISTTLTQKTGATSFGATSEFSGIRDGITTQVCDSLTADTGSDMVIDENNPSTVIKFLEAFDYSTSPATPIIYVISGGADGSLFTIENPTAASTLPCAAIKFISNNVVVTKSASANIETRAIITPGQLPAPGNYELPMDNGKDNTYDFQVTGTTVTGKKYVRDLSVRVMDTNEAPVITSAADTSVTEDTSVDVLTVRAQDPDAGDTLSYSISGGADASQFELAATTGILHFRAVPDYDAPMDTNRDNLYAVEVTVSDQGGLSNSKLFNVTVINNTADDGVLVNVKALLQGAYDNNNTLMSDALNKQGLLPNKQPYATAPFKYTGAETLSTLLQEATGSNAVVDWVLVELRSSPSSVVASRAVMLQRNGNLVDSQTGASTLHFAKVKAGNYYVSVRHRNHLAVISASPVSLDNTVKLVNFAASSTAVKGEESRFISGKLAMMWAGDINASNTLTANGPGNDVTSLLSGVISSMDNVQGNTNHILSGYLATDLNMDGKTLFTGPGNDTSLLVGNIILHPLNTGFAANYIVRGGL